MKAKTPTRKSYDNWAALITVPIQASLADPGCTREIGRLKRIRCVCKLDP